MKYKHFSGVSSFVLVYMLLAFIWWSVLLFHKNKDAYEAKVQLQYWGLKVDGLVGNQDDFHQTAVYQNLEEAYRRQKIMIIGEAIALSLSILFAMLIVYRSFRKELKLSQQQRNFLLSITHELKSPIASVKLSLETIIKQHAKLQPEQIERLGLNGIKDADRLNKLVGNILLSARLESAHQFNKESVDLIEVLEQLQQQYHAPLSNRIVSLNIKEPIPSVLGDEQALNTLVTNLIENAIKYSSSPVNIQLNLSVKDEQFVEIQVADNGIGIPKNERNNVFTKFYRIGNENTRKTKGTGLGLYIVYEIVKGHDGKVSVTENKPQGSIFSVLLPL